MGVKIYNFPFWKTGSVLLEVRGKASTLKDLKALFALNQTILTGGIWEQSCN